MKQLLSPKVFLLATVIFLFGTVLPKMASAKNYQTHPHYLVALSNLRAARWLIDHRPGNWQQTMDEQEAVRRIDAAIREIVKASIDDGKNLQDHPPVEERPDREGRLKLAADYLEKAKLEINREEDNQFAQGLQARAIGHIDGAIGAVRKTMMAGGPGGMGVHPNYLTALSDLRAARWMLEHRPGNWEQSMDEHEAVRRIDAAINAIKQASIDDGKNIEDHPQVDERPDHGGRLHAAFDFLEKARQDVNREEDNNFARGLKALSIEHINAAAGAVKRAMQAQSF